MSIGYACLLVGAPGTELAACTVKTATEEKLRTVIVHNLTALDQIMEYNHRNGIHLFRISSDIIPFGSHPVNQLHWWEEYKDELSTLGDKMRAYQIRVSMHPGQYTVLNSPKEEVVERAVEDLIYHDRFLNVLGVGTTSKLILHIGGVYGDKSSASKRFVTNFARLPESVKARLILENDDKSYTIEEVLAIARKTGSPVVFDNLHYAINPPEQSRSDTEWMLACRETWKEVDGRPKIHYSRQEPEANVGAHSRTILVSEFADYYTMIPEETDIMLEVKDKNLSAVKCIQLIEKNACGQELETEWARYKYYVLSRSARNYQAIRELLKAKREPLAKEFYALIESAMYLPEDIGAQVNAAEHVWGYISSDSTTTERNRYEKLLRSYRNGEGSITTVKKHLLNCAKRRNQVYLLESYYFYL